MQNLVFTQLSIDEVRRMLREEVRNVMNEANLPKPTPVEDTQGYMNIRQLSAYIGTSTAGIYGLVHRRQIPHIKKTKRLLFDKQEIDTWLQEGKQKSLAQINREAEEYLQGNPL